MKRLSRDEYFLSIASIVASRATCDRLWVGCVIVVNGEIISTGYNGAPSGMDECDQVGHLLVEGEDGKPHCVRTIHAEMNSLIQIKNKVRNLEGATAYINATPCQICLCELLKWGVKRIVCGSKYRSGGREEMIARNLSAWSAVMEYYPSPDIKLNFGTEVTDVKRIEINREG